MSHVHIIKEGSLKKKVKGLMRETWVKRFFQLTPRSVIEYLKKPEPLNSSVFMNVAEEKKRSWPLASIGVISNANIKSRTKNKFKIYFKDGNEIFLMADKEHEANEWINRVKNSKNQLERQQREISVRQSVSRTICDDDFTSDVFGENFAFGQFKSSLLAKNHLPPLEINEDNGLNPIPSPTSRSKRNRIPSPSSRSKRSRLHSPTSRSERYRLHSPSLRAKRNLDQYVQSLESFTTKRKKSMDLSHIKNHRKSMDLSTTKRKKSMDLSHIKKHRKSMDLSDIFTQHRNTSHSKNSSKFTLSRKNSMSNKSPRHRKKSMSSKTPRHKRGTSNGATRKQLSLSTEEDEEYSVFLSPKIFVQRMSHDEPNLEKKTPQDRNSLGLIESESLNRRRSSSMVQLTNKLDEFVKLSEAYTKLKNDSTQTEIKTKEYMKKRLELEMELAQKSKEVEEMKKLSNEISETSLLKRKIAVIKEEHNIEIAKSNLALQTRVQEYDKKIAEIQNQTKKIEEKNRGLVQKDRDITLEAEQLNAKIAEYNNQARLLNQRSLRLKASRIEAARKKKKLEEEEKKIGATNLEQGKIKENIEGQGRNSIIDGESKRDKEDKEGEGEGAREREGQEEGKEKGKEKGKEEEKEDELNDY